MYEDDKLVDNSIKALDKNQDEVVWENIKKDDITKYLPFEVNEQGEKVGQKVTLDGKTYDVIYNNPDWVDDGNVTYSITLNNSLIRVITIDKKWKTKTGEELKDNSLKATISILAKFDNIAPIKEEHNFDTKTPSNTYYVSSVATGISIGENGVELKDGEEAEVKIGNRTFIATLKEISKEHYEVTNREKSDKPVKPNSTKVKFSKRDIAGKELKDATIRLTHADGTSEEWKSNGTVKEFTVKEGKYTFKETAGSGWIPGIYRNYI